MRKFIVYNFFFLLIFIGICFCMTNWRLWQIEKNLVLQSQLTRKSVELNSLILDEFWEWRWQNLSAREKAAILNYCETEVKEEMVSDCIIWGEKGNYNDSRRHE